MMLSSGTAFQGGGRSPTGRGAMKDGSLNLTHFRRLTSSSRTHHLGPAVNSVPTATFVASEKTVRYKAITSSPGTGLGGMGAAVRCERGGRGESTASAVTDGGGVFEAPCDCCGVLGSSCECGGARGAGVSARASAISLVGGGRSGVRGDEGSGKGVCAGGWVSCGGADIGGAQEVSSVPEGCDAGGGSTLGRGGGGGCGLGGLVAPSGGGVCSAGGGPDDRCCAGDVRFSGSALDGDAWGGVK